MNGKKLLNNTLKVNAAFSLLSGLDFVLFDKIIGRVLSGRDFESLVPMGIMLIGFSGFVFFVSTLREVNGYLVGAIIAMDVFWVIGSCLIILLSSELFTTSGLFLIVTVAAIIALFASLQTLGLTRHLQNRPA